MDGLTTLPNRYLRTGAYRQIRPTADQRGRGSGLFFQVPHRPKWYKYKPNFVAKKPVQKISEYTANYRLFTKKQREKACRNEEVPIKLQAARAAASMRSNIKPPITFTSMYQSAYKQPSLDRPLTQLSTSMRGWWNALTQFSFLSSFSIVLFVWTLGDFKVLLSKREAC